MQRRCCSARRTVQHWCLVRLACDRLRCVLDGMALSRHGETFADEPQRCRARTWQQMSRQGLVHLLFLAVSLSTRMCNGGAGGAAAAKPGARGGAAANARRHDAHSRELGSPPQRPAGKVQTVQTSVPLHRAICRLSPWLLSSIRRVRWMSCRGGGLLLPDAASPPMEAVAGASQRLCRGHSKRKFLSAGPLSHNCRPEAMIEPRFYRLPCCRPAHRCNWASRRSPSIPMLPAWTPCRRCACDHTCVCARPATRLRPQQGMLIERPSGFPCFRRPAAAAAYSWRLATCAAVSAQFDRATMVGHARGIFTMGDVVALLPPWRMRPSKV